MTLGTKGMITYALAQTYRIINANRNRREAQCYGCGVVLDLDTGHEVHQQSFYTGRSQTRYLCGRCFAPVKTAYEECVGARAWTDWWGELGREPRTREERKASKPGVREIDALLAEREQEQEREGKDE